MKKTYPIFLFLCLMLAGFSQSSCTNDANGDGYEDSEGGEGSEDDNDYNGSEKATLYIDGVAYYTRHGYSHDNFGSFNREGSGRLYFEINAFKNSTTSLEGWTVGFILNGYSNVFDLKKGQTFDADNLTVRNFAVALVAPQTYCWDIISGSITIVSITEKEITLKFKNFKCEHHEKKRSHTIDGTVSLKYDPEELN